MSQEREKPRAPQPTKTQAEPVETRAEKWKHRVLSAHQER